MHRVNYCTKFNNAIQRIYISLDKLRVQVHFFIQITGTKLTAINSCHYLNENSEHQNLTDSVDYYQAISYYSNMYGDVGKTEANDQ